MADTWSEKTFSRHRLENLASPLTAKNEFQALLPFQMAQTAMERDRTRSVSLFSACRTIQLSGPETADIFERAIVRMNRPHHYLELTKLIWDAHCSRIVRANTRLFIERGFDRVKVDEIVEFADVSRMTVFNHFPRKENMFFDLDKELREELLASLDFGILKWPASAVCFGPPLG